MFATIKHNTRTVQNNISNTFNSTSQNHTNTKNRNAHTIRSNQIANICILLSPHDNTTAQRVTDTHKNIPHAIMRPKPTKDALNAARQTACMHMHLSHTHTHTQHNVIEPQTCPTNTDTLQTASISHHNAILCRVGEAPKSNRTRQTSDP